MIEFRRTPSSHGLLSFSSSPERSPEQQRRGLTSSSPDNISPSASPESSARDGPVIVPAMKLMVRLGEDTPSVPDAGGTSLLLPTREDGEGEDPGPLCGPGLAMAAAFIGPGTITTCG